jgi:hypothetical protein
MLDPLGLDDAPFLGSSTLDIGVGLVNGDEPPMRPDPRQEYVAAGGLLGRGEDLGYGRHRGPYGWHSLAEYERMLDSPAVGSSFNVIRTSVLSGGLALLPSVKQPGSVGKPGQDDGTQVEADLCDEIAQSNRRLLGLWETPLPLVLWEGLESLPFGHKLGEPVADDVAGGPDDGLLAIRRFKWKPRSSYRFRVDRAMNVVAITALAIGDDGLTTSWEQFDPDGFAWLTWDPYCGDPRGRSMFRMPRDPWKRLEEIWPDVVGGLKQFGTPIMWGTTAPGSGMVPKIDPKTGQPLPGPGVTAEYAMAASMIKMRGGSVGAGKNGSDIKVVESQKDSVVVATGIDIFMKQIVMSLLLQTRMTMEAQHGSRADSETGQDVGGNLVRLLRMWLERFVRSLLIRQNTWNYGEDIARRCTPLVDLGGTEHHDFAANAAAVGVLIQSSYPTEAQLPAIDTFLGLPQRQPGDPRVGPNGIMPSADSAPDPNAPVDPNAPAPDAAPPPGGAA